MQQKYCDHGRSIALFSMTRPIFRARSFCDSTGMAKNASTGPSRNSCVGATVGFVTVTRSVGRPARPVAPAPPSPPAPASALVRKRRRLCSSGIGSLLSVRAAAAYPEDLVTRRFRRLFNEIARLQLRSEEQEVNPAVNRHQD